VFEKFGVYRDQPVTPELCAALREHALTRGGDACDPDHPAYNRESPVFYYRPTPKRPVGPLTSKRYETLFGRIQRTLPFANEIHLTCHQLRKTGAVHVERIAGTQVARKWLGHGIRSDVDNYAQASFDELIEVHRIRFGDPSNPI
jgi:integrase